MGSQSSPRKRKSFKFINKEVMLKVDAEGVLAVNNGLVITLFILVATSLAIGYGFGVKASPVKVG